MGFKIAVFSLNQWCLDYTGNVKRIIESINLAHEAGAVYRVGPELELCSYSLEDGFYDSDTVYHCWTCLLDIIEYSSKMDLVIDIGMPVHNSALYNCRVIVYMGKIICIRAKTSLAREGNYREDRHFVAWDRNAGLGAYRLPNFVARRLGQDDVPFGADFILELAHRESSEPLKVGWDICQELWDIKNVSSYLYYRFGCHVIFNSSGSYWELRKLDTVMDMIKGISLRAGACYAYSNFVGCDGQRYVFYGRSCIYDKGQLVAMTPVASDIFQEVQMITYTILPSEINEYRAQNGIKIDISVNPDHKRFFIQLLKGGTSDLRGAIVPNPAITFEQEINLHVPLWLWDYLRRSGMKGFMVPLSGGLDSSTVVVLVYSMCHHIHLNRQESSVKNYFELVHRIKPERLETPEKICKRLLRCAYISTKHSSAATFRRASSLSKAIGASFAEISIQDSYSNFRDGVLRQGVYDDDDEVTEANSNEDQVSLSDQNTQARARMIATYILSKGERIVLATGNVDEAIMGYLTKYDCSSADINPIGGLCKEDLKSYLRYCSQQQIANQSGLAKILQEIISAPPSAELTGAEQRDEDEIGLTYDEISVLGKVRRGIYGCNGPLGAFDTVWRNRFNPPYCDKLRCLKGLNQEVARELAALIKRFYQRYARNRHKLTVLTPSLHAETYSPDDNRFDHRHFLFAPWTEQFKCIDERVRSIEAKENEDCHAPT